MTLDLSGRVALVTGATRGLGLAIARKLYDSGCAVHLNYAHADADAEKAVVGLSAGGPPVHVHKADVTRPEEWPRLVDAVAAGHGRLDIVVHNVATWRPMAACEPDVDALHADLTATLDPVLHAMPEVRRVMPEGGRVIAVSSSGSRSVIPGYVSLGIAKAALESLVRYLAVELAAERISVNAVATAKLDKGPDTVRPDQVRALAARTPAGRLTRPSDVADVVALLCSDEAAWVQGQVITADGGLGLRG